MARRRRTPWAMSSGGSAAWTGAEVSTLAEHPRRGARNVLGAGALIDAKKRLNTAKVQNFKFEVSGHTDTSGSGSHNKELSQKRAQVIVKELVARGVSQNEIVAGGKGSDEPLVKPAKTPGKKAENPPDENPVRR